MSSYSDVTSDSDDTSASEERGPGGRKKEEEEDDGRIEKNELSVNNHSEFHEITAAEEERGQHIRYRACKCFGDWSLRERFGSARGKGDCEE